MKRRADEARVYKYPIKIDDGVLLDMPAGAEVVHVGLQNDVVCLWAIVDPSAEPEPRMFFVVGTGHPIPGEAGRHVGTVPTHGGKYVWHVFARRGEQ